MAERVREVSEGLLCARQVSGLKCLANRVEVLRAIRSLEWPQIAERTVLAKRYQSVISLLRGVRVPRLQRLSKLIEAGFPLPPEFLPLLAGRFGAGNVFRAARVRGSTQVHNKCRKVLTGIVVVSRGFLQARKDWLLEDRKVRNCLC
jgi:hypothetical protein